MPIRVVVDVQVRRRNKDTLGEFLKSFQTTLTAHEWKVVHGQGDLEWGSPAEDAFRRFWSLKEAYVKARGDGLGFELG